jgi:choline kinase|tara:strand:- start:846 stop:1595 length:750 start_codon:yes stop_codon:yes gene_type:complete
MKVIFIAAGSSTRLGTKTLNFPKGLLKINNNSIIGIQLDLFKNKKISDIIIITGPNADKFNFNNVTYINDTNHKKHDVLGSLMVAKSHMNDEMITTYSDIIFDEKILNSIMEFKGDIGIAVEVNWEKRYINRDQHPKSEADNVIIENNKILKIKKNISECKDNQIIGEFIGLMKLSKKGSEIFKNKYLELEKMHVGKFHNAPSLEKSYLTDMLQELINSGVKISPIIINGNWCEIDTPQDIEIAKKILK